MLHHSKTNSRNTYIRISKKQKHKNNSSMSWRYSVWAYNNMHKETNKNVKLILLTCTSKYQNNTSKKKGQGRGRKKVHRKLRGTWKSSGVMVPLEGCWRWPPSCCGKKTEKKNKNWKVTDNLRSHIHLPFTNYKYIYNFKCYSKF